MIDIKVENKNIQILLETMLRCGGNCSGCALSSFERMQKSDFDFENFQKKSKAVNQLLLQKKNNLESITIFLGQGDHFLINDYEIEPFVKMCSEMVPEDLKHKTVIFITASAIGKEELIKHKMDMFYDYSLKYNLPFFVQVVFDPKKMNVNKKFKNIYMNNILYFKEKCGITEVTVNIGEDLFDTMSPQEFHDWIKYYQFKHIEINWVLNQQTYQMWKKSAQKMFQWLQQWLLIYKEDRIYEINFIPFLSRAFIKSQGNLLDLKNSIKQSLTDNIYIDYDGNLLLSQMGIISNLTPFGERLINNNEWNFDVNLIENMANNHSSKIINKIVRRPSCSGCEFQNVCATSGSVAWFDYKEDNKDINSCPWNIKDFLTFFSNNFSNLRQDCEIKFHETIFDKNPVQNKILQKDNNEIYEYFEGKLK